jgi:chorismate mutase
METVDSFKFAQAVAKGRALGGRPASREAVLARLLSKRAAAHRAGMGTLERFLRLQIVWSLPIQKPDSGAADAGQ